MPTKGYIDLHMHSHFSDGSKSPTALATLLHKKGVKVAALADHNTIHGQYEFQGAARKYNIKVIPAVEIYAAYKQMTLHILAYGIDLNNSELHDFLRESQVKRKKKIESLMPLLSKRGLYLDIVELFAQPATYIGMANVIRQIQRTPKNRLTLQRIMGKAEYDYYEIYNALFARGQKTHLSEVSLPFKDVMRLIKKAHGFPVLAHPGQQLHFEQGAVIKDLKALGLQGLECFSSHHNWDQTAHYLMLAKRMKLFTTGGTDYHGDLPSDSLIENYHTYTSLPLSIYQQIKKF